MNSERPPYYPNFRSNMDISYQHVHEVDGTTTCNDGHVHTIQGFSRPSKEAHHQ
jgi:hypothetical protein